MALLADDPSSFITKINVRERGESDVKLNQGPFVFVWSNNTRPVFTSPPHPIQAEQRASIASLASMDRTKTEVYAVRWGVTSAVM